MRLRASASITFALALVLLLLLQFLPSLMTRNVRLLPTNATYELTYSPSNAVLFDAAAWDRSTAPDSATDPNCHNAQPSFTCFLTETPVDRQQQISFSKSDKKKEVWVEESEQITAGSVSVLRAEDRLKLIRHSAFPVDDAVASYNSASKLPGFSRSQSDQVRQGLQYAFPYASEWRSYDYFDSFVSAAYPLDFQDREERRGTTLYRFHQQLQPVLLGAYSVKGAASQFYSGAELEEKRINPSDSVTLNEYYRVTRTVWVEPKTGTIVDSSETPELFLAQNLDEAKAYPSSGDRTVFRSTFNLSEDSQNFKWEKASQGLRLLKMLNVGIYTLNVLAVVLLAVSLYLARRKH